MLVGGRVKLDVCSMAHVAFRMGVETTTGGVGAIFIKGCLI